VAGSGCKVAGSGCKVVGQAVKWLGQARKWPGQAVKWLGQAMKRAGQTRKWLGQAIKWLGQAPVDDLEGAPYVKRVRTQLPPRISTHPDAPGHQYAVDPSWEDIHVLTVRH